MTESNCQRCHSLKAKCDEAFAKYPNSCSHSVWHVIKGYNPTQPYLTANERLSDELRILTRKKRGNAFVFVAPPSLNKALEPYRV